MTININNLPYKLISHIVSYVDIKTLSSLSTVNKLFLEAIRSSTSSNVQKYHLRCFYNKKNFKKLKDNEDYILETLNLPSLKNSNRDFTEELLIAYQVKLPNVILSLLQNSKVNLLREIWEQETIYRGSCYVQRLYSTKLYLALIKWAIIKDEYNIAKILLMNKEIDFSHEDLSNTFYDSIQNGQCKIVKLFIENLNFNENTITQALLVAIENHKIFVTIYKKYNNFFSENLLIHAFKQAIILNCNKVIKWFINNNILQLSTINVTKEIETAINKGNYESLQILLNKDEINLSEIILDKEFFLNILLCEYSIEIFELILNSNFIIYRISTLQDLYHATIEYNYSHNILTFLTNLKINLDIIDNSELYRNLVKAAVSENLKVTQFLFQNKNKYTYDDLTNILNQASKIGCKKVIEIVVKNKLTNFSQNELLNLYLKSHVELKRTQLTKEKLKKFFC